MHVTIVIGTSRGLGLAVTQAPWKRGHHVLAPGIIATPWPTCATPDEPAPAWPPSKPARGR